MAIPDRQLSKDGYERTFQSNHLGHFLLTAKLLPYLAEPARVIKVSSLAYQIAGSGLYNLNGEMEYGPWNDQSASRRCQYRLGAVHLSAKKSGNAAKKRHRWAGKRPSIRFCAPRPKRPKKAPLLKSTWRPQLMTVVQQYGPGSFMPICNSKSSRRAL